MCEPISLGIATAVVGGIGAFAQHQQQQQAVAYQNNAAWTSHINQNRAMENQAHNVQMQNIFSAQIANQNIAYQNQNTLQSWINQNNNVNLSNLRSNREYLNELAANNWAESMDELKYMNELNKSMLSKSAAELQIDINNKALTGKLTEAQQRLNDAKAVASFEAERLLVSTLKSQGSLLAQGGTGQSYGLAVGDITAGYNRDLTMNKGNVRRAGDDFLVDAHNSFLANVQANSNARNSIIPTPFKPLDRPDPGKPIFANAPENPIFAQWQGIGPSPNVEYGSGPAMMSGPSGIGLVAGLGNAALGGVSAGYSHAAKIKTL